MASCWWRKHARGSVKRQTVRPLLEELESRMTPAHLVVTSPLSGSASWDFTDSMGNPQQGSMPIGADGLTGTSTFPINVNGGIQNGGIFQGYAFLTVGDSVRAVDSSGTASESGSITWTIAADPTDAPDATVAVAGQLTSAIFAASTYSLSVTLNGTSISGLGNFNATIGDEFTATMNAVDDSSTGPDGVGAGATYSLRLVNAAPTLAVTTTDGVNTLASPFGPYLQGVSWNAPFTVSVTDPNHQVSSIKWAINGTGGSSGTAKKTDASTWTFSTDVGKLDTSSHTLTVTAYDKSGKPVGGPFTGPVNVINSLPLDLQANVPGTEPVDASQLRLIDKFSNPPTLTFTATTENLPLPDIYNNRLAITFVNRVGNSTVLSQPVTFSDNTATFSASSKLFHDTVTSATDQSYDYDVYLTPAMSFKVGSTQKRLSSATETSPHIFVVSQPDWLSKSKTTLFQNGDYVFNSVSPAVALLSVKTPSIVDKTVSWLSIPQVNGTTNSVTLSPNLIVSIPVDKTQDATATVNKLTAALTVLGLPVWSQDYTSSDVKAALKLDSTTLQPNDLTLTFPNLPQTIASQTFLDKTFTIPIKTPLDPAVTITASLGLKLTGALTIQDAGLELTWAGNQLAWVAAGTFIELEASATGTITAKGTAKVLGGYLGAYTAYGRVDATLTIDGKTSLGGSVSKPSLVDPSLTGTLGGSYYYSFNGVFGKTKSTAKQEDDENKPDGTFGSIILFTL